jgi:hypothetical protein
MEQAVSAKSSSIDVASIRPGAIVVPFNGDAHKIPRGSSVVVIVEHKVACESAEIVIDRGTWCVDAVVIDGAEALGYPMAGSRIPLPPSTVHHVVATNIGNGPCTFEAHLELAPITQTSTEVTP